MCTRAARARRRTTRRRLRKCGKFMAMRLAFDMDGVLADLHTIYTRTALKLYPELDRAAIATADVGASPPEGDDTSGDLDVPDPAASFAVNRRQSEAIWKHLGGVNNFWET